MYSNAADPSTVDVDLEYDPVKWSVAFPTPKECVENHFRIGQSVTERVKAKYPKSRFDVPYGTTKRESYDIYYKDKEIGSPIFVYIHGGYWQRLEKETCGYCVEPLVEKGYRVVLAEYNLCPQVTLEKIMQEMEAFMDHILDYAQRTGAGSVSLSGHSAGAHLLSHLLSKNFDKKNLVDHVFLVSGVYDLQELWNCRPCQAMHKNENPLSLNAEKAKVVSPMFYEKFANYAATVHLYWGEHEAPSFGGHAKAFSKVLEAHNFKVELEEFKNCDHFNIAHSLKDVDSEISKCIFKALKL